MNIYVCLLTKEEEALFAFWTTHSNVVNFGQYNFDVRQQLKYLEKQSAVGNLSLLKTIYERNQSINNWQKVENLISENPNRLIYIEVDD